MADIITTLQNRSGDNLYPLAGGMINDSITTAMLKDNIISTSKITNLAVTTDKIADSAVTTDKIADSAVNPSKTNFRSQTLNAGYLELYASSTVYIDFHYGNSTANYTSRIIADSASSLDIVPGSGGLKVNAAPVETVLYNNATGSNGTITLSSSAANFNYLKIFFRDNDNQYGYVEVYSPNGKRVGLNTATGAGGANGFVKTRDISISGTSISTYNNTQYAEMTINHNGTSSISHSNYIYIVRVVGGYYA